MASKGGSKNQVPEHSLDALGNLTPEQVRLLKGRWMRTVEALVSAANTDTARAGLAKLLGKSAQEVQGLLDEARVAIGPERFESLMMRKRGGPLGALIPEKGETDADNGNRGGHETGGKGPGG